MRLDEAAEDRVGIVDVFDVPGIGMTVEDAVSEVGVACERMDAVDVLVYAHLVFLVGVDLVLCPTGSE